jgi:hypothetical protein
MYGLIPGMAWSSVTHCASLANRKLFLRHSTAGVRLRYGDVKAAMPPYGVLRVRRLGWIQS